MNPLLSFCRWAQDTGLSAALAGSIWGYPVVGALHVLGIAWFGGVVLFRPAAVAWKRVGFAAMLLTGGLLFWCEPVRCYNSAGFRIKLVLIAGLAVNASLRFRLSRILSLVLLAAIVVASRAIAFL